MLGLINYSVCFILLLKYGMKHQSVDREKKIGIVLVVFGIVLPLILLPFVSGYDKDKGLIQNLLNVGIVLKEKRIADNKETVPLSFRTIIPGRVPYRFVLAFGVFLIFAGIVKIDISRKREVAKN